MTYFNIRELKKIKPHIYLKESSTLKYQTVFTSWGSLLLRNTKKPCLLARFVQVLFSEPLRHWQNTLHKNQKPILE